MNLSLGEFHRFRGGDENFLYMVGSGGIVALDQISEAALRKLENVSLHADALVTELVREGHAQDEARGTIRAVSTVAEDGTSEAAGRAGR